MVNWWREPAIRSLIFFAAVQINVCVFLSELIKKLMGCMVGSCQGGGFYFVGWWSGGMNE